MKTQDFAKLKLESTNSLIKEVVKIERELVTARMKKSLGQLKNLRQLSNLRRDIAKIKTLISQKASEK